MLLVGVEQAVVAVLVIERQPSFEDIAIFPTAGAGMHDSAPE
jgi:hypothetical protein